MSITEKKSTKKIFGQAMKILCHTMLTQVDITTQEEHHEHQIG